MKAELSPASWKKQGWSWTSNGRRRGPALLLGRCCSALALLLLSRAPVQAGGIVTNCSTAANFVAAVQGGGLVTFTCNGPIPLTNTILITRDTILDGGNIFPTISGSNRFRLFTVSNNVTLTLLNLTVANGRSTNGGGIYNSGTLLATNCTFLRNSAQGSNGLAGANATDTSAPTGSPGGPGGSGQPGLGGAIYSLGTAILSGCNVSSNASVGGSGGNGGNGGGSSFRGGKGGAGGSGAAASGGAIYNLGKLTLLQCTVASNLTAGGSAGAGGTGGTSLVAGYNGNGSAGGAASGAGLYNGGFATSTACTFSDNAGQGGNSTKGGTQDSGNGIRGANGGNGLGGGTFNSGTNAIVNCTFSANSVTGGTGGDGGDADDSVAGDGGSGGGGRGGCLLNYTGGRAAVTNCTFQGGGTTGGTNGVAGSGAFAGNDGGPGASQGGNLANLGVSFTIENSILAFSLSGQNCFGVVTNKYYNFSSDATPVSFITNNLNIDPLLGPLADNGGPTKTFALLPGSPAVGAGDTNFCLPTDQRGVVRTGGAACDLGAYEFGGPPTITQDPADQTVTNGTAVVFGVSVAGEQPLQYQWHFNSTDITGATNSTYTVTNVQAPNVGFYDVLISNDFGSANSGPGNLTVLFSPAITQPPLNQTNSQGGQVDWSVGATGDAPLSYQWLFGGSNIFGATGSVYTIVSAETNNAGNYQVIVSNHVGSVTSAVAVLTVVVPAFIATQPTDFSTTNGATVIFKVVAGGSQPLTYQWRFNGANLPSATLSTYAINNVNANNAGTYDVVVSNGGGTAYSDSAVLILMPIKIAAFSKTANNFSLTFPAQNGLTYVLEYKANLTNGPWARLSSTFATTGSVTLVDTNAVTTSGFYRVQVE